MQTNQFLADFNQQPTKKQIDSVQQALRIRYPQLYEEVIQILYRQLPKKRPQKFKQTKKTLQFGLFSLTDQTIFQLSKKPPLKDSPDQTETQPVIYSNILPQSFERVQIKKKQTFNPTPTKYQIYEQFKQKRRNNELTLKPEIYNRFGGVNRRQRAPVAKEPTSDKIRYEQYQITIQKFCQLKDSGGNRQFRLYAYKLAPRFQDQKDQTKYEEKRLAAKAFCERGYGLKNIHYTYLSSGGSINVESKRYKTVANAIISQSYRRFQIIFTQEMGHSIRPLTSPELRSVQTILLNAEGNLKPAEYDCYRKIVKYTYDLGSVSLHQQQTIDFYIRILLHLKTKLKGSQNSYQINEVQDNLPDWIVHETEDHLQKNKINDDHISAEGLNFGGLFEFGSELDELELQDPTVFDFLQ